MDTVDLPVDAGATLVATLSHRGSRNFAVQSYGNGQRLNLLVNHIGPYTGTVPLNLTDEPDQLEIDADGSWMVTISDVFGQPVLEETIAGTGDEVLVLATRVGRLDITHDGESNFAVLSYGNGRELLINKIGIYNGTVQVSGGALVLEIAADGNWTIEAQ